MTTAQITLTENETAAMEARGERKGQKQAQILHQLKSISKERSERVDILRTVVLSTKLPHKLFPMKIILPGGSGQLGHLLARSFHEDGHEVVVLSRSAATEYSWRSVEWDAQSLDEKWAREIDGADVVINLAGRSVNCRYTAENRKEIIDSRVRSTEAVGQAIAQSTHPPRAWLQMSSATVYPHRYDAASDEYSALATSHDSGVPETWNFSVGVVEQWEKACREASTPRTRRVLLRSSMVMSADDNGVFDVLLGLVRRGLGGRSGNGRQYVAWIHGDDYVRALRWIIDHDELEGAVNICAPQPLPNAAFMLELRRAWGTRFGLAASEWMIEIGTFLMRTESELVLKSRRVVPTRLLQSGFEFDFPQWPKAAQELVKEWRRKESAGKS